MSTEETAAGAGGGGGGRPLVAVIMGSKSDWETMRHASDVLKDFGVAHECRVVSAHRTPGWMAEFAGGAEARGLDSLLSIVQMPAGVPVGTLAIGQAGATNAALLAVAVLAGEDETLRERLRQFRQEQERQVREAKLEEQ